MELLLTSLPDELVHWRGTAAELADRCNSLLPRLGLEGDAGSVNERLVRYYVSEDVLTPPEREGREAMFGFRQVIELMVTRYLLKDGWPLRKIATMVRSADLTSLQNLVPSDRPRTRAEEAIARFRVAESRESPGAPDAIPQSALGLATQLTRRKAALQDNLRALGNEQGVPVRRQVLRIALTSWCEVHVDARQINALDDDRLETLGTALIQALQEERTKRGEQP